MKYRENVKELEKDWPMERGETKKDVLSKMRKTGKEGAKHVQSCGDGKAEARRLGSGVGVLLITIMFC